MIQIECNVYHLILLSQLLLRKNILDQDVIELESATDRQTFLAYEISDLIPDKEKTDQFSIVIKVSYISLINRLKSILDLKNLKALRQSKFVNPSNTSYREPQRDGNQKLFLRHPLRRECSQALHASSANEFKD